MTASHVVPPEPPPVVPGQILAGKFRVERLIGEGGMGIVAEATHLGLDERVALKFLKREVMRVPDVVARFDREARACVKLKSEHVARVSDVGKTEDGIPFMVMELLVGRDLAQTITEQGPLPIQEAVEYVIQACEGVGEAHARGIVHRDLKPENLFVVQRDGYSFVKVLDFGISKAVLVGASNVDLASNQTTNMMGSPYYMSPEQLRSTRSVDHRADLWSLGVVLFELLTCATIWDESKEFTELVADILEAPERKLVMFRPDAPPELEAVIDRCLQKDRTKRFQNVAELAAALLPFAPRRSRVTVERTLAITRAAGLLTDPAFQLPPSIYPTGNLSSSDSYPTGRLAPPAAPLPSDMALALQATAMPPRMPTPIPQTAPPSFVPLPPQSAPSLAAGAVETSPTPRKRLSPAALLFGALLFLGVGVVLAYGVIRTLRPAQPIAAQTQPTTSAEATASAKVIVQPSATETVANDTPSATSTHTTSVSTPHTHGNNIARPPTTTTASATQTAAPTHPSLDIQLTR